MSGIEEAVEVYLGRETQNLVHSQVLTVDSSAGFADCSARSSTAATLLLEVFLPPGVQICIKSQNSLGCKER